MKVFVFCFAILLANAVKSSPIDVEDEGINESEAEPELDVVILVDNDEQFSQNLVEHEELEELDEVVEKESNVINESEGEADVPHVEENNDDATHIESPDQKKFENLEQEKEENSVQENDDNLDQQANPDQEEDAVKNEIITAELWERIAGIAMDVCVQHTDERHPLHLSHPSDCTTFYMCSRGRAYLMDCPNHEHWSVKMNRCDYRHLANCQPDGTYQYKIKKAKPAKASSQDEDSDQSELGEFEVDPRCEGSDPFKPLQLRHPTDCTKFYKCYMGKAYVIKCPKGQQWAQTLNRCEHPQIARCSIVRPAIKPAQAIEESEEEDDDDDSDEHTIVDDPDYEIQDPRCAPDEADMYHPIHFAHPTECTMFYRCEHHKGYKAVCPLGLYFNEARQYCDYPWNVECQSEVEAEPYEASIVHASAPEIPNCPAGEQEAKFPVEGSQNQYFSCEKGLVYLKNCEGDDAFNPASKKCEKVTRPQQQRPNQFPFPGINQYPQNLAGLSQNFPGSWNQFYEMMNQYPGAMQMYPQVPMAPVPETPNQIAPQIPNIRPQQIPQAPQQPAPGFPSWLPVPNPNVPMPELSNPSLNPQKENSNQFNFEKGQVTQRCPSVDDPTRPTHLSHETDCSKFYKCYNGRAFELDCPSMQEFSDELQRCDYHQFAKCDPLELIKKKIQN